MVSYENKIENMSWLYDAVTEFCDLYHNIPVIDAITLYLAKEGRPKLFDEHKKFVGYVSKVDPDFIEKNYYAIGPKRRKIIEKVVKKAKKELKTRGENTA